MCPEMFLELGARIPCPDIRLYALSECHELTSRLHSSMVVLYNNSTGGSRSSMLLLEGNYSERHGLRNHEQWHCQHTWMNFISTGTSTLASQRRGSLQWWSWWLSSASSAFSAPQCMPGPWGPEQHVQRCATPRSVRPRRRSASTAGWRTPAAAASCVRPGRGRPVGSPAPGTSPAETDCTATLRGAGTRAPGQPQPRTASACAPPPGRCAAATAGTTPASVAWEPRTTGRSLGTEPRSSSSREDTATQVAPLTDLLSFYISFFHVFYHLFTLTWFLVLGSFLLSHLIYFFLAFLSFFFFTFLLLVYFVIYLISLSFCP